MYCRFQKIQPVTLLEFYIVSMPERRLVKANPHAVPLMLDIVESTLSLPSGGALHRQVIDGFASQSATETSFGQCEYFLGFEEHFPFGFVGLKALDDCGEFCGPFLYRDYVGKGLGDYLMTEIIRLARAEEMRLLFTMIPRDATRAQDFLIRNDFESISGDAGFIKRWRDGLLADRPLESGMVLFARLIGLDE